MRRLLLRPPRSSATIPSCLSH